jgi:hypothetical protein
MKRLAVVFGILCLGVFTMFIEKDQKKKKKKVFTDDFIPGVEDTGPHGEPVLVGSGGGRYYKKGGKKIYLRHKK